ncbi:MAG: sugar phosphate isomerase/epimerase [Bacteroidales bacterium]|nr:sugar phosphate isomerase/epimerase [Bacteroidales bacterium]
MKNRRTKNLLALSAFGMVLITMIGCSGTTKKTEAESDYAGVQIGVITYSWRSMPSSPEDIIKYCGQTGISSLELMGNIAEEFAGAPAGPEFPPNFREMSEEEREEFRKQMEAYGEEMANWRINEASPEKYRELKAMFDEAGIHIHTVKFSPATWSDAEIDYAFESARILGARAVTNEIGHEAARRLGPFAEKHDMYAVFHNHGQPGDTAFNFEDYLAYSPNNMLNLDVGHYFGATGLHPNELISKLHKRIYSIHLKDKTGKDGYPPDTNARWGQGDTPLGDILKLIEANQWDIYCDIELEYEIPEGSDAVIETGKCVDYARKLLAGPVE